MKLSLFSQLLGNPANGNDLVAHNPELISLKTTSGFDFYRKRSISILFRENTDETDSYIEVKEVDMIGGSVLIFIPIEFIEEIHIQG